MSTLGTLVSDFKKAGTDVKDFLIKVAGEAPTIVAKVTTDAEAVVPVIEAFLPGSTDVINLGNKLLDLVAQAVEDAGAAAEKDGLAVQLDKTVVADMQAIIAAAKAASAKKS
jgi:hypothetical protein